MIDIGDLVASLRAAGTDSVSVEVKAAEGGLPTSMVSSLCALANLPGGGRVILGLDERTGFRGVGLTDPERLKAGLASLGRQGLVPPLAIALHDAEVDGQRVVVADIPECPPAHKPCAVAGSGRAFIRGYDGDYEISEVERAGYLAARTPPLFDRQAVPGSTRADLAPDLLASWLANVRERDPRGLGRFDDDDELLRRAGVTTSTQPTALTVAGMLALGVHPQQWFPNLVIQAASRPVARGAVRAVAPATISGPVPVMLDTALDWARRILAPVVTEGKDGHVRNDAEYPLIAIRELLSNALVHRDLADWSTGYAIEVRHLPDRFVVTNPGGLFGITLDRLGEEGVTSARNATLLRICQFVEVPSDEGRVVEALATGIPIVQTSLRDAGLPAAQFIDYGIRFTAILRQQTPFAARRPLIKGASAIRVWRVLAKGERTLAELREATGLAEVNLHRILRTLRNRGVVEIEGGPGKPTTYRRAAE
jgi:ATP-dependent DNA helicase RecG